jgi:hypothetical protein
MGEGFGQLAIIDFSFKGTGRKSLGSALLRAKY